MTPTATRFREICVSTDPLGASLALFMAWIATSDGSIAEEEIAGMRMTFAQSAVRPLLPEIIVLAAQGDIDAFETAAGFIRQRVASENRVLFLEVMVQIALADGVVRTTESHIVRLVSDLLELPANAIDQAFMKLTGRPFPRPGDVSRRAWWREAERRSAPPSEAPSSNPNIVRIRALAILGLDEEAGVEQVRVAYRRLAQVHHPDKFASLGPDAVAAATESFRRIKNAYEELTRDA